MVAGFGNRCFLDSAICARGAEHSNSVCGAMVKLVKSFEQEAQFKGQIQQPRDEQVILAAGFWRLRTLTQ
jgi:hypothetical protein